GVYLAQGLGERFAATSCIGDIRGRGLFRALEFVADRETRSPFEPERRVAERIKSAALDQGLAIYPTAGTVDGRCGDHVLIAPPYNVTAQEIDRIVEGL